MKLNHTDQVTLAGLYLSKFGDSALTALSCLGVWQAFNILGYALGASPASIKNYRDEFDYEIRKTSPLHPRKGWKRPLKRRSQILYGLFAEIKFEDFTKIIKEFLIPSINQEKLIEQATNQKSNMNIAQRLMTGQAAEAYFKLHYQSINIFKNYTIEDMTSFGCGYDFHLSNQKNFYCIEVKGMGTNNGTILMIEKEYMLANNLKNQYCLFIVRNFQRNPFHSIVFNPTNSGLSFISQPKITINYSTYISEII